MATTNQLLIQFGDGGSPEDFNHACTINTTREFTIEGSTVEAAKPNCEDPNKPSWVLRVIDTLSAGITGAGTMDPVSYGVLRDKVLAGEAFAVRVTLAGLSGVQGGGYFEGPYVMTSLGLAKEGKGFVNASTALASADEIVWVDAA